MSSTILVIFTTPLLDDVQLGARLVLAEDHGVLRVVAGEVVARLFQVHRLGVGVDLRHPLLRLVGVRVRGAVLQESVVGVVGLVVLALPRVVLGHLEQVRGVAAGGVLECQPREGLVEEAHLARETLDDLQRHGRVALDEQPVLLAGNGDQRNIGEGERRFDVAVGGHRGNDAEEVARGEGVAAFLLHDLHFLADADLAAPDDVEVVGFLLPFDDDVRVPVEVDDRQLKRARHAFFTVVPVTSIEIGFSVVNVKSPR